jgi:16S rRNA (guanine1516-N2)-methyltransferase
MNIAAITYTDIGLKNQAQQIAAEFHLVLVDPPVAMDQYSVLLTSTPQRLELSCHGVNTESGTIYTDFLSPAALYRRQHGGGRRQLLARAVGLHQHKNLTISDISAGFGHDAFVLACLGANVTMIERSPIIGALVCDGWRRAQQVEWVRKLVWELKIMDSREYLAALAKAQYPDVIYFDPMFPERKKSALVKKEMRILREIVGEDLDAPEILALALQKATKRVVVKRPRLAPALDGIPPSFSLTGQSSRYDIYTLRSVP